MNRIRLFERLAGGFAPGCFGVNSEGLFERLAAGLTTGRRGVNSIGGAIGSPKVAEVVVIAAVTLLSAGGWHVSRAAAQDSSPLSPLAPLAACDSSAWQRVNIDISIEVLAGEAAGGFVYAGSKGGANVYRSALSEGDRWTNLGALDRAISSFSVGPGGTPLLIGLFGGGVKRSDDNGETYSIESLSSHYVTAVAAGSAGSFVAASRPAFRGVYVDRGDGSGYVPLGAFDVETFLIWRLSLARDGTPWVGTNRRGPYRWDGSTWQPAANPEVAASTVHAIAFDTDDDGLLYLGLGDPGETVPGETVPKGLRISRNGGATYEPTRFSGNTVPAIVTSAANGRAFASIWGDGLHMTLNHGATWRRLHSPEGAAPYFQALLAIVPAGRTPLQCELLFAGDTSGLWVRNVGSGRAWLSPVYLPYSLENF